MRSVLPIGLCPWASVWQGRRHADEQAALNSGNLARVIAQNLEADIRAIDLGLIALTREIAREQATGGIKSAQLNTYIEGLFRHYPTLDSIRTARPNRTIFIPCTQSLWFMLTPPSSRKIHAADSESAGYPIIRAQRAEIGIAINRAGTMLAV